MRRRERTKVWDNGRSVGLLPMHTIHTRLGLAEQSKDQDVTAGANILFQLATFTFAMADLISTSSRSPSRELERTHADTVEQPIQNGESSKSTASSTKPKSSKNKKRKTQVATPGIVYISRVPPGMTPQKVRHLMARWGEIGKVYAQRKDGELGVVMLLTFSSDTNETWCSTSYQTSVRKFYRSMGRVSGQVDCQDCREDAQRLGDRRQKGR